MANRLKLTPEKILEAYRQEGGTPSLYQVTRANGFPETLCEDDQAYSAQLNYAVQCLAADAALVAEVAETPTGAPAPAHPKPRAKQKKRAKGK
jgi:hypothetical protein